MKVLVNYSTGQIESVIESKSKILPSISCYTLEVDNIDDKIVPKGFWRDLKNDNNQVVWEERSGTIETVKGFVVSDQQKIKFKHHPNLWTIEEILKEKYEKKLKQSKFENVYYQEFVEEYKPILFDGNLNFGKKLCTGKGILVHQFTKSIKEFELEINDQKDLPTLYVSSDSKSWCKVETSLYRHKFKKASEMFYLKLDDSKVLSSYSIYY